VASQWGLPSHSQCCCSSLLRLCTPPPSMVSVPSLPTQETCVYHSRCLLFPFLISSARQPTVWIVCITSHRRLAQGCHSPVSTSIKQGMLVLMTNETVHMKTEAYRPAKALFLSPCLAQAENNHVNIW
jgi:hypothetical protein